MSLAHVCLCLRVVVRGLWMKDILFLTVSAGSPLFLHILSSEIMYIMSFKGSLFWLRHLF